MSSSSCSVSTKLFILLLITANLWGSICTFMTEHQYLSPSIKARYMQLHCSVQNHIIKRELSYSSAVPSAFSAPEEHRKRSKFKSQPQLRRQACSRSDVMYRPMNIEVASQLLNIAASHMKFTNFSASDQQKGHQRAKKNPSRALQLMDQQ